MQDEEYMRMALELAARAKGFTNPNPMVGAVIVKDGRVIGMGYHRKCGELHAERNALADCRERGEDATGATLYVTLEPCCHYGKTPPCTEAILEAGISRVVVGCGDANPLVAGKGIAILREHGVTVDEGVLEGECLALNKIFFHYMKTKRPYVIFKYAMTMDGKIATVTGASKWITGSAAREHVHWMRHELMGIMVGIRTVELDDPMLDCRIPGLKSPVRIVCDSTLRISEESRIVKTAETNRTIIATCSKDADKRKQLEEKHCEILVTEEKEGRVDLNELMEKLGAMGIDSILLEGGATLGWEALKSGVVNEIHTFLAPKIFGGATAPGPVGGCGVQLPDESIRLRRKNCQWFGDDLLIESEVVSCLPES